MKTIGMVKNGSSTLPPIANKKPFNMALAEIIIIFLNLVLGLTFISSLKEMTREEKLGCAIAQSVLIVILIFVI